METSHKHTNDSSAGYIITAYEHDKKSLINAYANNPYRSKNPETLKTLLKREGS